MRKIVSQCCPIVENQKLDQTGQYFRLRVKDFRPARPIYAGQFVHIKITEEADPLFRRAFSIAGYDKRKAELEIIYKIIGRGTALLARKSKGDLLNLLGPLGHRFSSLSRKKTAVLVAGGVGLPPLYFLAAQLIRSGHQPRQIFFLYGVQSKNHLLEMKRLRALGVDLVACTDDGSYGLPGSVTDGLKAILPKLDSGRIFIDRKSVV
jgi:dihydroorotate dehydrogenase electron transfer subunit